MERPAFSNKPLRISLIIQTEIATLYSSLPQLNRHILIGGKSKNVFKTQYMFTITFDDIAIFTLSMTQHSDPMISTNVKNCSGSHPEPKKTHFFI